MTQTCSLRNWLTLALAPALVACADLDATDDLDDPELATEAQDIINGTAVDAATIRNLGLADVSGCSAVLYRNDWVLTAGHCVSVQSQTDTWVNYDGTWRISDRILRFAGYNEWKGPDLALIHLTAPFAINGGTTGFVRAVHVTSHGGLAGQAINLYGRGQNTTAGTGFGTWRTAPVTVSSASGDLFGYLANAQGQTGWFGDSGGPSFVGGSLVGIQSGAAWTCADNSPPGQCWNQTPVSGSQVFLSPLLFGINTAMDRPWNAARTTDQFDISGHEIRAARELEQDLNVAAWAQQRRVASEACENRGFAGGHFNGHQLDGLYGLVCSGMLASWYDATAAEVNATGWGFYNHDTVPWAQAARAAYEVCRAKGHVSGFFNGFQIAGSRYGLICIGSIGGSHFDATWSELAATGWRVDDVNYTGWAQAQRAAHGWCASRGWKTGFMNGHQWNGRYGVTCQS